MSADSKRYYSVEELHATARNLFNSSAYTQEEVAEAISKRRAHQGRDPVGQSAVAHALRKGGRRYAHLLCDIVDTLINVGGRIEREDGQRPKLFVRWTTEMPEELTGVEPEAS